MKSLFLLPLLVTGYHMMAQTNMYFTNPAMYQVLKGNYDPLLYAATQVIDDPQTISLDLLALVNPDSLKATLFALRDFDNRNTGSDTLSANRGMGAARTWVLQKFNEYNASAGSRLETGYFQFDQDICEMTRHKNVVAVLPGRDITDPSAILIEAHLDSRCKDVCDVLCRAEGMEDNGSGVALVLELARVMSKYTFDHTLVFVATTGEEQGLDGANALADFMLQEGIQLKAVMNNDVVGGIICGETASNPACPGLNHIDSTQVRLFASGGFNSPHKAFSRFIKLEYNDMMLPHATVPMKVSVMAAEDRTGRGGDHIPFRENGYTSTRFTSANEHGNADVDEPDYHDRQHTSDDILGVDTDGDQVIDSFFVDFNYLARNTMINGNAAAMVAIGPETPAIGNAGQDGDFLYIDMEDNLDYNSYVVGIRSTGNDFDSLYYIADGKSGVFALPKSVNNLFVSAASIDSNGVESLFSEEILVRITGTQEPIAEREIALLQNVPNPFDESTIISFYIEHANRYREAVIQITDLSGRPVWNISVGVKEGINEVLYHHGYNKTGTFLYSLVLDGRIVATKKMVFAN